MSVEQAEKTLIMANAGYQLGNDYQTLNTLISQYNELANKNAVEVNTLSEAWQNSASMAKQANLAITDYNALITVAGNVSQKEGSELGNALRTWFMRLQGVTDNVDTLEEDVSKVDKVLSELGIQLKKSPTEFKPIMESITAIASKYKELGETGQTIKQSEMLEAMAGKYRANIIAGVLNNFDQVNKAIQDQENSFQSAEKENSRYMESITAKVGALKAEWELFSSNLLDSNLIKGIIDFGRILLKITDNELTKFILTVGSVTLIAWGVSAAIQAIGKSALGTAIGVFALDTAQKGLLVTSKALFATLAVNPLFWVAAATATIYGIVKVFDIFTVSVEEQKQKVEELTEKYNSLKDKITELSNIKNPTESQKRNLDLLEREKQLQEDLLKIEKERLVRKEIFGEGVWGKGISAKIKENIKLVSEYSGWIDNTEKQIEFWQNLGESADIDIAHLQDLKDQTVELESELLSQRQIIADSIDIYGNNPPKELKDLLTSIDDILPSLKEMNGVVSESPENIASFDDYLKKLNATATLATETLSSLSSELSTYDEILEKLSSGQDIYVDDIIKWLDLIAYLYLQKIFAI
jgi:TP901 family phage tail tape measure protein